MESIKKSILGFSASKHYYPAKIEELEYYLSSSERPPYEEGIEAIYQYGVGIGIKRDIQQLTEKNLTCGWYYTAPVQNHLKDTMGFCAFRIDDDCEYVFEGDGIFVPQEQSLLDSNIIVTDGIVNTLMLHALGFTAIGMTSLCEKSFAMLFQLVDIYEINACAFVTIEGSALHVLCKDTGLNVYAHKTHRPNLLHATYDSPMTKSGIMKRLAKTKAQALRTINHKTVRRVSDYMIPLIESEK